MNLFKALLAGAAIGVIVTAFRDSENDTWLIPAVPLGGRGGRPGPDELPEPVLGYDGMDQETLIDWLGDARLDRSSLTRMRRYEMGNRGREAVLAAIDDLL